MEQLDFVEELLDSWRDSSAYQLAEAATKEELETDFGALFLEDRRVFPGSEDGGADSSRKKKKILGR